MIQTDIPLELHHLSTMRDDSQLMSMNSSEKGRERAKSPNANSATVNGLYANIYAKIGNVDYSDTVLTDASSSGYTDYGQSSFVRRN